MYYRQFASGNEMVQFRNGAYPLYSMSVNDLEEAINLVKYRKNVVEEDKS